MVKRNLDTKRTQAERSGATRAALLDAARELFSTRGYADSGREEIVAAAGVTRGALQHHFGDKQSLFLAVYEEIEQGVVETVAAAAVAAGDDALEQLRAGCRAYLDAVRDPAVQRICAIDGPAVLAADARQEIIDRYALGLVRMAVQKAVDTGAIDRAPVEVLTRMLLAGVMAMAQFVATSPDPETARVEAGAAVDLLLDGLTHRPAATAAGSRGDAGGVGVRVVEDGEHGGVAARPPAGRHGSAER